MASSCPGNKKFLTAEASTKAAMRTERAIDEFLNIINVKKFRELNTQWSNNAKERFNIEEPLFMEDTVGGKLKAVPNKRMFKAIDNAKGIFYQEDEVPVSTSSPETITKVKRVIESMGVKLQSLSDYLKGNPNVDARGVNALTDLTRGIIAIAEGKEDVALTEEMVHIATAILEQTRPRFITEMISKIGNFKIYNQVLEAYKNNPKYQLPDGKPDIRKIKKEAVDKLIAEVIINQNEGSTEFPELMQEVNRSTIRTWWQKILDWFRGEYRKANINIFEEAAQEVMSGRTGVRYYNDNKLGVDRLFEENPELADIGTKEQYSAYLQTIFPDSKVKDIVYHGSVRRFEKFIKGTEARTQLTNFIKKGIYLTSSKSVADSYTKSSQDVFLIKYMIDILINNANDEIGIKFIAEELLKNELWSQAIDEGLGGGSASEILIKLLGKNKNKLANLILQDKNKEASDILKIILPENNDIPSLYTILINSKSPLVLQGKTERILSRIRENNIKEKDLDNIDSLIFPNILDAAGTAADFDNGTTYVVFEPEQIHILGSKQDIEGFKEWIKTAPAEFKGNGIFFQQNFNQIEKVSNMIVNKLSIKNNPFFKRNREKIKDEYWYTNDSTVANRTAKSLLDNIIGNIGVGYTYQKTVKDVYSNIRDILNNDLVSLWKQQLENIKQWESRDSLDKLYADKRLIQDFSRRGVGSLSAYSNEDQSTIKNYLPSLFKENKYVSDKQAMFLTTKRALKRIDNKIAKDIQVRKLHNIKKNAIIGKYETLLNLAEIVPDYKQRIEDRIINEIERRLKFKESEFMKNPNISNVLKFRALYNNAGFMTEQSKMSSKVENKEISDKINSLFDNMNYEAETGDVVAESWTVDFLNRIISQNSKYSDLAKYLLPYAEKHNVHISLINRPENTDAAGKTEIKLGQGINKKGEPYSYITDEDVLIDYTSVNYQVDPERLILHELVHTLSTIYIESEKYKNSQLGKANPLTVYMNYIKKVANQKQDRTGYSFFGDMNAPYGFTNESEFVSEALTNPYFIEMLKSIPAMEVKTFNNLFEELLAWIAKIFNINVHDNAYDQLYDIIHGIIDNQSEFNLYAESPIMIGEETDEIVALQTQSSFYKPSDAQKKLQKRILDTKANIEKRESKEEGDPILLDTEEANNWYVLRTSDGNWERITKRVTDRVKAWYKQRFPDKAFTEEEKELNEFKRSEGVKGHKFLEEIHKRFFDEEGIRRERPLERPVINNKVDREIYHKLEKYYVELIDRFSKDGKKPMIFSEVIVYDPKQKEAGTIDLLIVEENGRANIIDWKFLSVGKDATDIAWYKQGAYNVQLGRYKDILMKQYGVKSIGMNRAIPILFDINYKDLRKKDSKHELKGIVVGSVDVSKIKTLTLTPVSEESESTELLFEGEQGWQKLDNLIIKLNSLYKQIAKKKATDEEERDFKRERLNSLRSAIRAMQSSADLTPLIETISLMRREGEMIIDDWNTKYRDTAANNPDVTNSELSDFAESLREYRSISDIFRTIDRSLGHLIYNSDMENDEGLSDEDVQFRKDVLAKVQEEARLIDESYENVVDISKKFADKFMGVRNLVAGLLKPEAIVRGLGATFRGVSELPLKSLEILYKMINNAKAKATQDALKEVNRLLEIRTKLAERGGDLRQLVRQIYQKDEEGKLVNKLIYRYDKGFYDGVKNNSLEGNQDKNWLQDNVDMVAYKTEADEVLRKRIERINDVYKNNRELRESLILQENRKWDTTRADFTGWDNYILKRHPLPKWESTEYKELKKDADLLDLYNFIHSMNEKAVEAGYISNRLSSTFLPWVRKSLSESLAWDFSLSAIGNWSKELTLRAGDVGYGQVNELTGEYEYAIPKYYSYDFTKDDKGYENVSEDIFKNMILYINHMEKYKYMSDIEQQLLLVKNIETFKQHLDTARNGDVVNGIDGKPTPLGGNEENTRMFDTFLRALLYEQKYPLSAGDTPLGFGKAANYVKSAINKVAGREIYKIDEEASVTSLTKSIDAINRGFQLKTLGFEFISGAVNMFGGNIQMATQAGNYFKAKEFMANEVKLLGNKFKHDDERDMFIQLIDTFMPLKDDPTYERLKKAGMSTLTRGNFSDIIMMFMRQPELHLERSVFLTLLENMMIVDGRIISIREYVKSKYKNRYTTGSIYKESSKQIEAEIAELRETKSMYATKKLVDGKLEIPGLDLSNRDELQRLTTLTRRLSRNATGALSDSDLNNMSFNVWTKSMMVFKNWIPKLVDTRFGEFRKIHDDFSVEIDDEGLTTGEKYDIGRIRLFFGLIGMSVRDKGNHIMNILEMNDKGIEILDRMYEEYAEKYERQTGDVMNLSREEFIDLIRNNLSNQMKELGMLLSLVAASFALGFIGPDDDDSRADKNFYRFWQRVFDRFIQELSFFYNPVEFQKMLSGSAFPAIGLISDMLKAMDHFTMQVTGYDISNLTLTEEEVREKAQPIKNIARMFPGTKSLMTYGSILSEDWAREFDITIQKETRK